MAGAETAAPLTRLIATIERRPWPWAAGGTVLAAAVTYGPYIPHGGRILDDWLLAGQFQRNGGGLLHDLRLGVDAAGGHPVSGVYTGLTQWMFGLHASWHLAWIVLLGVLASLALFAVLRELGVPAVFAIVASVLVLVCPAADATRLWIAAGGIAFSLLLLLVGVLFALAALRRPGWPGLFRHLPATALYVASVLCYDAVGPVVLALVLLYLTRAPWRRALAHWAVDAATVIPCLLIIRSTSSKTIDTGGSAIGGRVSSIVRDGFQLLISNAGTLNGPTAVTPVRWPIALALALVGAGVLVVASTRSRRPLSEIGRVGLAGVVVAGLGLSVLFVVSGYGPLDGGTANRVNVVTAIGIVLAVFSTLVATVLLALRRRSGPVAVAVVSVVVGLVMSATFVLRVRYHEHGYIESVRAQKVVLDRLRHLPPSGPRDVVYVSGPPSQAAPKVPIFAAPWDLSNALALLWDRPVTAVPGGVVSRIHCEATGLRPDGPFYGPESFTRYGSAVLIGPAGEPSRPRSISECRSAVRRVGLPLA